MAESATSTGLFLVIILAVLVSLGAKFGLAFIPANIAKKKGYGFAGFYILGLFFFIIGLIVVLCLDDKNAQINRMTNAIHNSTQTQTPNIGDELKKYNELLQQGAITRAEYDSLKEKLLK